jgi:hypothetical protein
MGTRRDQCETREFDGGDMSSQKDVKKKCIMTVVITAAYTNALSHHVEYPEEAIVSLCR